MAMLGMLFIICLLCSYKYYGLFLSKKMGVNDRNITPAHQYFDKTNFLPTKLFWLFPQHFSAISAAGPIAGPIIACLMWGWLPCVIWLLFGVIFIGAVHDFFSLLISVRYKSSSMAVVAKNILGKKAGIAMMLFIFISLIYVIIAFTDITAASFVFIPEELSFGVLSFNPGGAVAFASVSYLFISLLMGVIEHVFKPRDIILTIIFLPLVFLFIWLGTKYSTLLLLDLKTWSILIILYCFIASLLPVWLLLKPRGYLGGFILYLSLAIGMMGIFLGGYDIKQPAIKSFDLSLMSSMFPFLLVSIACGACSGFHGLVCSGTTAKQIDKESHIVTIGYGAMLCEAMVAFLALATVMIFTTTEIAHLKPGAIFGQGIGRFLTMLVGEKYEHIAITFGAMAFSTFVFDTIDVATRLGRYLLQELLDLPGKKGAFLATFLTIMMPLLLVINADTNSYMQFWTIFGASNQLLAAITLLIITVWLYQNNHNIIYTLLPTILMFISTISALVIISIDNLIYHQDDILCLINAAISICLLLLAIYFIGQAYYQTKQKLLIS